MSRHIIRRAIAPLLALCFTTWSAEAQGNTTLASLREGASLNGFRAAAVYLNDDGEPMGARFVHERTGFILDLLQIQSVPEGYIWVNTYPTSDMGEPHTQEHLLLGKGNIGRYVANLEGASLSTSSAYTRQWQTCYFFNTAAGPEVYYKQFEARIDALLHPDYTDEEIRREVCNFGVTTDPGGKLRLEEKGTVYNEMVSSFERSWSRMSRQLDIAVYGAHHPLAYVSGGLPEAIRRMTPADIRKFHHDHYRLDNMGMIGAFPKEMPVDDVLRRTAEILNRLEPGALPPLAATTSATLPAPTPAAQGGIYYAEYPNSNETLPSPLLFAWPAQLEMDPQEQGVLELFLENVAGDQSSNLYRLFIDSKTRKYDFGAGSIFSWTTADQGHPIYIGLDDVPQSNLGEATVKKIRTAIISEIERIASWKDGSAELREFNARARNRVIAMRRGLTKLVNSPPGFGFRGTSAQWLDHLAMLARSSGFRKSVTLKEELAAMETMLAAPENRWRALVAKWKLTTSTPAAGIPKPSAALVAREAQERKDRIAAEVARLRAHYGAADDQAAIEHYRHDYDSATAVLEQLAAQAKRARFIDQPPLTLDDQLDFTPTRVADDVPMVTSTFDNMSGATTGIALRLDGVAESDYTYLSLLPTLLTNVGIYENGTAISADDMSQKLREEILGLNAYFSSNWTTGRSELVITGAGNDREESRRSITWMKRVLFAPDWRAANLPRIRDVVDQALNGLRGTMQGSEESWVNNPAGAWRFQDHKLMLATESFLTREYNAHRLRWLLKDAGNATDARNISALLTQLADAGTGSSRSELVTLAAALGGDDSAVRTLPARFAPYMAAATAKNLTNVPLAHLRDAGNDLGHLLAEIPDATLASDWRALCLEMRDDLLVPPTSVLAAMDRLRKHLLVTGGARMFMIGSHATAEYLGAPVTDLLSGFEKNRMHAVPPASTGVITERLRQHGESTTPVYVGLVNPNTQSGVFISSAPVPGYRSTDRESLLEFLATKLYAGHGAHGVFMKTWAAGLAYSNGLSSSPGAGRVRYYAERCPELPQTVRFVIEELKKAKLDTNLAEYAIGLAFEEFRSASSYESRGEAMAADLADGITPDLVRAFRRAILALRNDPHLAEELFKRMPEVYGRVLPGYNVKGADVQGGIFFVIGPEKQMGLWEQYLRSVEQPDTRLHRLYPRDFWLAPAPAN